MADYLQECDVVIVHATQGPVLRTTLAHKEENKLQNFTTNEDGTIQWVDNAGENYLVLVGDGVLSYLIIPRTNDLD